MGRADTHITQGLPGQIVKMNFWHSSGDKCMRRFLELFIDSSNVAILMFSPDDLESFQELKELKEEYLDLYTFIPPKIYLVLAKSDIPKNDWKVQMSEVQRMADEFKAKFYQISSKNNKEEQSIQKLITAIALD